MSTVFELNQQIINAHNAHIKNNKNELIDQEQSPNGNLVYHLYSNGIITYQKGGNAYLCRSEFTHLPHITYKGKIGKKINGKLNYINCTTSFMLENYHATVALNDDLFIFPIETKQYEYISYAILTKEECEYYREKMGEIVKNMKDLS